MFLLVLLLILIADILFLKMLTYKKKDEKQYFYKVNKELKKNFVENSTYEGTVYFNSEFIPNILIKNGGKIITCPTGLNIDNYQKVDFSKENIIIRNNCKISLNNEPIFKEYKYRIDFYFILEKSEYIYEINALVKSENSENLDAPIVCYHLSKR